MKILSYLTLISVTLWLSSIICVEWQKTDQELTYWEMSGQVQAGDTSIARRRPVLSGTIRTVTAYNVGDVNQTDSTPCIGAKGDDLCELLKTGLQICAANFVKLGSFINIEGYGRCQVLDRMAKKNDARVDIAFSKHQVRQALEFGKQKLLIKPE